MTEISESRPVCSGSETVGWEHWIYFQDGNGPKVGHMIGTSERTGDFEADFAASQRLLADHREACSECQEKRSR